MNSLEIDLILSERIGINDIKKVSVIASGNPDVRNEIWKLAHSSDRRTSANALWIMTHLYSKHNLWIRSVQNELIDMLMEENDSTKKRLLLKLLTLQDYSSDNLRTDFLDFCLSKINSECESFAVRNFCIHNSFLMCRCFPELLVELESHLDMMEYQVLSPGLKNTLRQTKRKILKLKDKSN